MYMYQALPLCLKKATVTTDKSPYLPKVMALRENQIMKSIVTTKHWVGQKVHSGFCIKWYGKIQMNFLVSPVKVMGDTQELQELKGDKANCTLNLPGKVS